MGGMAEAQGPIVGDSWGSRPITLADATAFAQASGLRAEDRAVVAKNLAAYPADIEVRGLFFEGVFRLLEQRQGASAVAQVRRAAGLPESIIPFRHYAHRDFYKLYYLTAARLHPGASFGVGLRRVAQSFFPIFRGSILGRTMNALMGDAPETILPLLSKAYNLSVNGNRHTSQMTGERELTWQCTVEPVEHYDQTFTGIIEGTMTEAQRARLQVVARSRIKQPASTSYEFVIRW
jgi:uncharacterized protein (TIGR02265 family)